MSKERIYVNGLDEVSPEDVRKVREGSAMLAYPAKGGRSLKWVARDRAGRWREHGGRGWGTITDQAARVFAPEIAEDRAARRARRRRAGAAENPYSVGDVLHASWGYDMTHCDFFQVTAVTERTITIRHIRWASHEETGYQCGLAMPQRDGFADYVLWDDEDNRRGRRVMVGRGGWVNVTRDGVVCAGRWGGRPELYDFND